MYIIGTYYVSVSNAQALKFKVVVDNEAINNEGAGVFHLIVPKSRVQLEKETFLLWAGSPLIMRI